MRWLLAFTLSLCLLLGIFLFLADFGYAYQFLYRISGVYEELPWTSEQIEEVTWQIRNYLFARSDNLFVVVDGELVFLAQEIFHLWEVRFIFHELRRIFLGLLILLAIGLFNYSYKVVFRRQLFTTCGIFVLFGVAAIFFEKSFLWMHQLLFNNPYWGFTYDHRLIQLLKEGFFRGFLLITMVLTLLVSIFIYQFRDKGGSRASYL
ncbi:MAG TPA: DUF1461 domain-containing protein [Tissierellia bacterium]|jgi:integral membrane protein (TIGR01906 family)|nr:DUF1461 domain-containing protein [Tissierellia bacterium]